MTPIDPSISARLSKAVETVNWLHAQINETPFPSGTRNQLSLACFGIAQDHHGAIVLLMSKGNFASAFALIRSAMEALLRGSWLLSCATDEDVRRFWHDKEPKTQKMIEEVEKLPPFALKPFTRMRKEHWAAMCSFTHTGGLQAQRWIQADAVEPIYSLQDVEGALMYAEYAGALSVVIMLEMIGKHALAQSVVERVFPEHDAARASA
jgi:hypothetical protein